ncbi:biotin-dependent carboxyltransferase family protein [Diaminobutyricibacter sp. McL0618]|uniref:5-oxoprolinase subunit C family protein n=1 Tax=Leifsonia sp. McL0618 TaxID=3415677 RepID=UPI003CF17301
MTAATTGYLEVLEPGPLTLVEDLGRPGHADIGVTSGGALDRGALRLANRLLGNDEGAAGLEILFGGFTARLPADCWFAVTGAWGAITLDGTAVDPNIATAAGAGAVLRIGSATRGVRFYLAVRGGVASDAVLGSRSTDLLSSLGPAPVAAGDRLPLGIEAAGPIPLLDFIAVEPPGDPLITVRAHPGPRSDWFTHDAVDAFFEREWAVSAASNRIGTRLEPVRRAAHVAGRAPEPAVILERRIAGELPSEPMVAGAVQVSPDGLPTVLLADHPVTGGYPVIAVVADRSLDVFAQLRPGQRILFRHA